MAKQVTDTTPAAGIIARAQAGPIPDRVPCRVCGRRDGLDAVVTDEEWAALGFDPGWYVCLWCMDARAAERGMELSAVLHYAGNAIYATSDLSGEPRAAQAQLAAADALAEALGVVRQALVDIHDAGLGQEEYCRNRVHEALFAIDVEYADRLTRAAAAMEASDE